MFMYDIEDYIAYSLLLHVSLHRKGLRLVFGLGLTATHVTRLLNSAAVGGVYIVRIL